MADSMALLLGNRQPPVSGDTAKYTLLTAPNQPWHLNALLGDKLVDQALTEGGQQLNDAIIVKLLTDNPLPFYTDVSKHYLMMGTSELLERDFGPLERISSIDALFRFGLAKMEEANERVYVRL